MDDFTIAAAQSHSIPGVVSENVLHHGNLVRLAAKRHAKVVVFPELSLTGYEPTLAADAAIESHDSQLKPLQNLSDKLDVAIIAGCPIRSHESKPYIGAFVIRPKQPIKSYRKRFLHSGEEQHFEPGADVFVCAVHGKTLGIAICADLSNATHPLDVANSGAASYAAGVAMTPGGIGEAEINMATYASRYGFLSVMANYASPTGGYQMAGRSAIWDESGSRVAGADTKSECLVLAKTTTKGWRGDVVVCDAM